MFCAKRPISILLTCATVLCGLVAQVHAVETSFSKGEPRSGWILGLVLGEATGDFAVFQSGEQSHSGWSGGGRMLRGRLGWFARPNLRISGEYGVWRRAGGEPEAGASTTTGSAEEGWTAATDRYLGAGLLAVNLYPHLHGLSLRVGAGFGRLEVEFTDGDQTRHGGEYGALAIMGAAYEIQLSKGLSVAAEVDAVRFESSNAMTGTFVQGGVAFQMNLPTGLLRDWF